jgi:hypothetical protein
MNRPDPRYSRWAAALALLLLALVTLNTLLTAPNGATGLSPGTPLPPFAVPLVTGSLQGAANVVTRAEDSSSVRPACTVRGPRILNVCELYEHRPLVLALFVDAGSCAGVLGKMQTLAAASPDVSFAAVSIKGDRGQLRALVHREHLGFPIGIDEEGTLAALYKLASCPQLTLAYPGDGLVQSKPLLVEPTLATLRTRVNALLTAARARGWRPSA